MKASLRRISLLAAGLALFSACSSEPISAPQASQIAAPAAAPSADLLGGLVGGVVGIVQKLIVMPGLQRTTPLAANITVTKTIGTAGGTLSIPAAGVTVVVPAGALSSNTVITMTARKGYLVAYDFAPHGVVFAKPLVFSQKLQGTNASILSVPFLQLGYYTDPGLLTAVGGIVSELLGGTVNLLSWTYTGNIKHFSGYMIGCGRGAALE
ncbi:MAG: hypothetical protein JWL61_2603 [Gemmatimonadetes bacterium]|jgi:hypothetical protein|nr:hypothetical protein [Gemmatimonadota bacterium]